ncbi:MAG: UDP-2,3-diacylglucosamine diphosphatase [Calditrichaeota bacterium]|nr:MAG: UDP-2,3-diacylglucosamine diphosphatase [Calditrichota bacterium]
MALLTLRFLNIVQPGVGWKGLGMGFTYFISDVHLGMRKGESETEREDRLLKFFDHVGIYGDRLIIVGDLFDFWFEYRTVIPRGYMRTLSALNQLRELGKELHYVAGNHDFWMRDFLPRELGIQIHFDAFKYTIAGKHFYIHHGDGIAKWDKGYRLLKRIFRNRINIFLYSLLHPDLGIPLAKWVSHLSRQHTFRGDVPDDTDYRQEAMRRFEEGYDYVVFGHLHYPTLQEYGEKVYVNLGDWIRHFSYGVFNDVELMLRTWE